MGLTKMSMGLTYNGDITKGRFSLHSSGTTIFRVKLHRHAPVLPGLSQKLLITSRVDK